MYSSTLKNFRLSLIILLLISLSACTHSRYSTKQADIQELISEANSSFYLDSRIWYQNIHAEVSRKTITLTGEAFFKIPVNGIIKSLKKAGFEQKVVDQVSYLPESFPEDKAFGIVIVPYVMSRYKPVNVKQEGTELLYGEAVRLIRDSDPYYQVQSATGYLGFIPKNSIRTVKLEEWVRYHQAEQAIFDQDVELKNGFQIKRGTRLPFLMNGNILLANGDEVALYGDSYHVINAASNPLRQKIIKTSEQYLDLPYVWGGRSSDGLDCSGFVMQSYGLNGLHLPRDTDEMSNVGRIIGLPGWMDSMLPGDLLFFAGSRRLVTHVAIYIGDDHVIHSLGEGVQIHSLNPEDEDYSENLDRSFIFAKRIFD
ncbi:MAG: C40 family peptidase [Candidatus Marinimicrobia bacterium]|nr:C40 family peptidase [Candidatus Neomarinimicrobiota bacterium]